MWWKIAKLAGLFFLGFGAAQDIKYQKISTEYLLAGSCAAILYRALFGRMHWSVWVAGLGCGIVFLMISKWSQEGIGYGDSWMILNMGIFLGIWNADACIFCGCDGSRSRSLERKMETDDKNVILSFSSDRLSGDIYMVKLKGSTVVEMAYLMPVVLLCWMAVIFALFYYHDKNIIGGAAYETAIVGSEEWRWQKEIEDGKMEQYFQKRIENKLIFFDTVSVETAVVKDEFEVTAGAQKRKMRVSVKRSAALTVPEEKIRRKKVLQEIVERDQEE